MMIAWLRPLKLPNQLLRSVGDAFVDQDGQ